MVNTSKENFKQFSGGKFQIDLLSPKKVHFNSLRFTSTDWKAGSMVEDSSGWKAWSVAEVKEEIHEEPSGWKGVVGGGGKDCLGASRLDDVSANSRWRSDSISW